MAGVKLLIIQFIECEFIIGLLNYQLCLIITASNLFLLPRRLVFHLADKIYFGCI